MTPQSFIDPLPSHIVCVYYISRWLDAEKEQRLRDALSRDLNAGFAVFWVLTLGKLLKLFKGYLNQINKIV